MATDRRALSDVASIVKKSNNKLQELKSELHELESQIILTQANSNGKGKRHMSSPFLEKKTLIERKANIQGYDTGSRRQRDSRAHWWISVKAYATKYL